ncbi:TPA: antirestriction protein ArdA [Salmonella enterica subsp. enterica serovar Derby]|jgi:antirestriction protein
MSAVTPAVYVGTYHKYNCGSIAGQWFDLTDFDDEADFYEACHQLHQDEHDPELMFQDYEGFPDGLASESHIDWSFVDAWQQASQEGNSQAFVSWVEYSGVCDYEAFRDAYRGEANSEEDFAVEFVEECQLLEGVPETMKRYFDYEAYARDLFLDTFVICDGFVFYR